VRGQQWLAGEKRQPEEDGNVRVGQVLFARFATSRWASCQDVGGSTTPQETTVEPKETKRRSGAAW